MKINQIKREYVNTNIHAPLTSGEALLISINTYSCLNILRRDY